MKVHCRGAYYDTGRAKCTGHDHSLVSHDPVEEATVCFEGFYRPDL